MTIFMALREQNIERERHRRQFKTIKNLRIINWICVFLMAVVGGGLNSIKIRIH
jgi:hypothetical protein